MSNFDEVTRIVESLEAADKQLVYGYIDQLEQWLALTGQRGIIALSYVGAKLAAQLNTPDFTPQDTPLH